MQGLPDKNRYMEGKIATGVFISQQYERGLPIIHFTALESSQRAKRE